MSHLKTIIEFDVKLTLWHHEPRPDGAYRFYFTIEPDLREIANAKGVTDEIVRAVIEVEARRIAAQICGLSADDFKVTGWFQFGMEGQFPMLHSVSVETAQTVSRIIETCE